MSCRDGESTDVGVSYVGGGGTEEEGEGGGGLQHTRLICHLMAFRTKPRVYICVYAKCSSADNNSGLNNLHGRAIKRLWPSA